MSKLIAFNKARHAQKPTSTVYLKSKSKKMISRKGLHHALVLHLNQASVIASASSGTTIPSLTSSAITKATSAGVPEIVSTPYAR